MMNDIYADGIGNVRLAGTNVRIDLLVVGDQPDKDGKPAMQKKAELIMPLSGLIRANTQIQNVLDQLTEYAINYFRDKVEPNKKYKIPNEIEKKALINLASKLDLVKQNTKPEEIQTIVYSTGKENGYEKNLREWFILIYEVLFGSIDGPRMGFFISFFGVKETIKLIEDKINK